METEVALLTITNRDPLGEFVLLVSAMLGSIRFRCPATQR